MTSGTRLLLAVPRHAGREMVQVRCRLASRLAGEGRSDGRDPLTIGETPRLRC